MLMLMIVIDLNKPSEYIIFDMIYLTNEFSKINTVASKQYEAIKIKSKLLKQKCMQKIDGLLQIY